MSNYSVFKPKSSRGIFIDYPEMRHVPAFTHLNNNEMLFVWYYACESSPYYEVESDRERTAKAIKYSFNKKGSKISSVEEDKLLGGKFSTKISDAITEMKKFRVAPRIRAMMVVEKGFKNMEIILNIDASDSKMFLNKDDEVDFSKKKAYVDTLAKAVDLMPKLVDQLEGRYSLHEEKEGNTTFEGESLLDKYHENETS